MLSNSRRTLQLARLQFVCDECMLLSYRLNIYLFYGKEINP